MGSVEKQPETEGYRPKLVVSDKTRRLQIFGELIVARAAELAGRLVAPLDWKWMRDRIATFDLYISGLGNLTILDNGTAIITGNHLLPIPPSHLPISLEGSAVSPDSFIIKKIVEDTAPGRRLWFAGHFDMENRLLEIIGRGFYRGHNAVPITKRPGAFNRELVRRVGPLFEHGDLLHMYPEGRQYPDFDPIRLLHTGTAHFARRFNKPIIPYYIFGATSWKIGQQVEVAFGPPITPHGKTKEEITQELLSAMTLLQRSVKEKPSVQHPI